MDNINDNQEEIINEKVELDSQDSETLNSEQSNVEENIEENNVSNLDEFKKLKEENMTFKDKNKKLENELEALKDRLLRLSSEYENYRRRTDKEKEGIYTNACEDILKRILPVLDNLERAAVVEGDLDDIKKGIDMTIRQFIDALEKLDVVEIDATGEFDPNVHQAVMHNEDEAFGANQVAEVFQKGYKRGDKVIRHTMVRVVN
ncbi:MAG: nucleotide exchange factor GrpE [Sarcina ventriculi]|jgi:molecular chaperone GrpE|uniref:Nucleotide exchange factor GrpE n=2 Tax=Sarcina TaxID=1266 RepID=A0ACD1BEL4_9CLOT|nr:MULTISPECIES: nucleotide exchange factor GrpE [Sarcina]MDO4401727.1 nucleotide exchange factor GrpE [Clostridiaceae bacterium]MBU5321452.1 nucleotide exchange factor GrpE [Sarcina ventriculi]MCI5636469.1 nucleotide exchange factor GrpE [Sarcina ventriculi]MDD7373473.1 nucleotide exchange factor GrpE [Sarcina ventriculi]MDY7062823.1 nucleotide exchange factor GrpE [Sarcina ventriculi]